MATRKKSSTKRSGKEAAKPRAAKTKAKPAAPAAAKKSGAATAKYDQPGAPWWKKIPLPLPK